MQKKKVFYGIPTYTEFERCRHAVEHILTTSTVKPDEIAIIDNSEHGLAVRALEDLTKKYSNVFVIPRTENILSGAWNDLMNLWADDYIIIANDDVTPHSGTIEAMLNAAIERPNVAMFNGSGHSGNSYSFFLLRRWAYEQVGNFDEEFIPAYFEDNDYDYRLRILARLIREEVPAATFDHVGSATMKGMDGTQQVKHHASFVSNERRYLRKWGGKPGREQYTIPYERMYMFDLADL